MKQLELDNSIRLKMTNRCQLSCSFCHNEGTELPENSKDRVSFCEDSSIGLSPVRDIPFDPDVLDEISKMGNYGVKEIHLTGGEPTLNTNIADIVGYFNQKGFTVKMTSNGQFNTELIKDLAKEGLKSVNFSILSLDTEGFLETQIRKSQSWAQKTIDNLSSSIMSARSLELPVKANTVINTSDDYERVDHILQFCNDLGITLVLLNNVSLGKTSEEAVFQYVKEKQGKLVSIKEPTNNSRGKRVYLLPNNQKVEEKYFREYYPDIVCRNCPNKGENCLEKYYGIRVELRDVLYTRLCIQNSNENTLMPLTNFFDGNIYNKINR